MQCESEDTIRTRLNSLKERITIAKQYVQLKESEAVQLQNEYYLLAQQIQIVSNKFKRQTERHNLTLQKCANITAEIKMSQLKLLRQESVLREEKDINWKFKFKLQQLQRSIAKRKYSTIQEEEQPNLLASTECISPLENIKASITALKEKIKEEKQRKSIQQQQQKLQIKHKIYILKNNMETKRIIHQQNILKVKNMKEVIQQKLYLTEIYSDIKEKIDQKKERLKQLKNKFISTKNKQNLNKKQKKIIEDFSNLSQKNLQKTLDKKHKSVFDSMKIESKYVQTKGLQTEIPRKKVLLKKHQIDKQILQITEEDQTEHLILEQKPLSPKYYSQSKIPSQNENVVQSHQSTSFQNVNQSQSSKSALNSPKKEQNIFNNKEIILLKSNKKQEREKLIEQQLSTLISRYKQIRNQF